MTTEQIWKDFNRQLFGFINTRVNDKTLAEDILQDVFIKIHLKSDNLNEQTKIASWLYQITRNTIIDFYRKKKIPVTNEINEELISSSETNLPHNFENCLIPFVNQLPAIYKDAILKTELGTLSQKEYAKQLNISYSTAKSRVQRAKLKLQESFISCCNISFDKNGNANSANSDCAC